MVLQRLGYESTRRLCWSTPVSESKDELKWIIGPQTTGGRESESHCRHSEPKNEKVILKKEEVFLFFFNLNPAKGEIWLVRVISFFYLFP